jgi:hypothetical protein
MSWLADFIVWAGLFATSTLVLVLHWRLSTLSGHLDEYRRTLAAVGSALITADDALRRLAGEGREVAVLLAGRIAEARMLATVGTGRAASPADFRRASSGEPVVHADC